MSLGTDISSIPYYAGKFLRRADKYFGVCIVNYSLVSTIFAVVGLSFLRLLPLADVSIFSAGATADSCFYRLCRGCSMLLYSKVLCIYPILHFRFFSSIADAGCFLRSLSAVAAAGCSIRRCCVLSVFAAIITDALKFHL